MRLGDSPDDGQPEPGAPGVAASSGVHPPEALEHPLALFWRSARSLVGYGEADSVAPRLRHLDPHQPRFLRRVVDRVPGEVAKRLGDPVRVGDERSSRYGSDLELPLGREAEPVPELRDEALDFDWLG